MGKEHIVEIPEGSGNRYRYLYEKGFTHYLGPVGSAPPINEEMLIKILARPSFHAVDEDIVGGKTFEIGWVNRDTPDYPQLKSKIDKFYKDNKRDFIELPDPEDQKPKYVAMLDGEVVGVVWTISNRGREWYQEWVALGMKPGVNYQMNRSFVRMFTDEMVSSVPKNAIRAVYQMEIAPMEDSIYDALLDDGWEQSKGHPNNFFYIME